MSLLRDRLICDWRQASKWWSVRMNAIGALLLPALTMVPSMPPEVQAMLPLKVRALLIGLWCIASLGARVIAQKKPSA